MEIKEILQFIVYILGLLYYGSALFTHFRGSIPWRFSLLKVIGFSQLKQFLSRPFRKLSVRLYLSGYLINNEIIFIVALGLLMNAGGALLTGNIKNVLFLDMVGTAFCAYLLGPWYGALCGLISNSFMNYVLFPGINPELIVFPWSLVNMAGGFYWGYLARLRVFKLYMSESKSSLLSHIRFVMLFGVFASLVMSIPGSFIQLIVGDEVIMQDSRIALAIKQIVERYCLESEILHNACRLLAQAFWSIPDKAISASIAVVILRLAFPLFERELIHGKPERSLPKDGWLGPIIVSVSYIPSFIFFTSNEVYQFKTFYILWSAPWLIILLRAIYLAFFSRLPLNLLEDCQARKSLYDRVLKVVQSNTAYEFYQRLRIVTLISSLIFILGLPILKIGFYGVAGTFLLIVGGFLFSFYALQVAVGQNALATESVSTISEIQREAVLKTIGFNEVKNQGKVIQEVDLPGFKLFRRGKVKHIYESQEDFLVIASDRILVFDRETPTSIPRKGEILTKLSAFWFNTLKNASPHHFITAERSKLPNLPADYLDRAMLVKRLRMVGFECIVRGYLAGSAWREYSRNGTVFGKKLRKGLQEGSPLDEPLFTPTVKNNYGYDVPISMDQMKGVLGPKLPQALQDWSFALFTEASTLCWKRGLILCDTKFEFGWQQYDDGGEELVLGDELLTPDSSRFLKASEYVEGSRLRPWDRQIVENYLEEINWSQIDPFPEIPEMLINETARRFREIYQIVTGVALDNSEI